MSRDDDRLGPLFDALADHTRREVMRRLSADGPATATDLAARLPVTRQAVAKHLAALDEVGLVSSELRGRERLYRITPEPLGEAMTWMADVGAEWDSRLDRLKRYLSG